jgi:hypothetical protein
LNPTVTVSRYPFFIIALAMQLTYASAEIMIASGMGLSNTIFKTIIRPSVFNTR